MNKNIAVKSSSAISINFITDHSILSKVKGKQAHK